MIATVIEAISGIFIPLILLVVNCLMLLSMLLNVCSTYTYLFQVCKKMIFFPNVSTFIKYFSKFLHQLSYISSYEFINYFRIKYRIVFNIDLALFYDPWTVPCFLLLLLFNVINLTFSFSYSIFTDKSRSNFLF